MARAPIDRPWSADGRPAIEGNFAVPFQEHIPKDGVSDRTKSGAPSPAMRCSWGAFTRAQDEAWPQGQPGRGSGAAPHVRVYRIAKPVVLPWALPRVSWVVRARRIRPLAGLQSVLPCLSADCLGSCAPLDLVIREESPGRSCTNTLGRPGVQTEGISSSTGTYCFNLELWLLEQFDPRLG
jgi:hypothetical protein